MEQKLNPIEEPKEIAYGTTIEEIKAAFFDANALRQPTYRLFQVNSKGQRYYCNPDENGIVLHPSVTTILKSVMPENKFLTEWRMALGKEASESYTMDRARFGTFVHGLLQELVITRKFNIDSIHDKLSAYIEREKLPMSFIDHEDEAKYDMLSFAKWMHDYDVRPLAVEICLYHPELGFAGMIDTACSLRKYPLGDKRGDERIPCALIDYKTTTKDFHDEHAIQLGLYREMWNLTFPDMPVVALANVSPKEWWNTAKKQVSYNFEWQTDNPVLLQIPHLIELYKLLPKKDKKIVICTGEISVDSGVDSNVTILSLEEAIENSMNERAEVEETQICDENDTLFGD